MKTYLLLMALLLSAVAAEAQSVRADRFVFNTGPCVLRSGSGSPEGVVVGNVCDQWHRTDSPYLVYIKRSGSGNTGWLLLASTDLTDTTNLPRLNTTNTFSGASNVFNAITVHGAATIDTNISAGGLLSGLNLSVGLTSIFQGDIGLDATKRLYLDGVLFTGNTYLTESSADTISLVAGGTATTLTPAVLTTPALVNANGGIAVDTTNFTVSGTTGAIATTAVAALTTAAESWVGPSTTTGMYFKSGNVGIGTITPSENLTIVAPTSATNQLGFGVAGEDKTFFYRTNAAGFNFYGAGGVGANVPIHFFTGGGGADERLTILGTGNVGIGTTSPAVGRLEVRSSTNDEGLIVVNSKNSGTKYGIDISVTGTGTANYGLYLDALNATANYSLYAARGDAIFGGTSGRVGIGVGMTAPDNLFHVRSTAAGGVATMKLENSNADAAGDLFQIRKNSASPAAADTLGTIQFRGNDSTAVDTNFADIIAVADDVVDATEDGSLLFAVVEAGTKATRVTIKGGLLGVGVTPTRRLHIGNSTLTQFIASQATPPTCSTNCGTSPAVTGSDTFMTVTMGTGGVPASGFVITFSGAWPSAPSCVASMAKAGMVVGKLPLTVVTTTTTITVVTNGTAPATTDKYHFHCGGPTG